MRKICLFCNRKVISSCAVESKSMDLVGEIRKQGVWGIINFMLALLGSGLLPIQDYVSRDIILNVIFIFFIVVCIINFKTRRDLAEIKFDLTDAKQALIKEKDKSASILEKVYEQKNMEIERLDADNKNLRGELEQYSIKFMSIVDLCQRLTDQSDKENKEKQHERIEERNLFYLNPGVKNKVIGYQLDSYVDPTTPAEKLCNEARAVLNSLEDHSTRKS